LLPIEMMRPPSPICRATACAATKAARVLIAMVRSKSSSVRESSGFAMNTPALLTRTLSVPSSEAVRSTAPRSARGSALSARIATGPAGRLDIREHALRLIGAATIGQGHVGPLAREPSDDRRADAATAARDERHLACKLRHLDLALPAGAVHAAASAPSSAG
jgi:hypothetical protein